MDVVHMSIRNSLMATWSCFGPGVRVRARFPLAALVHLRLTVTSAVHLALSLAWPQLPLRGVFLPLALTAALCSFDSNRM